MGNNILEINLLKKISSLLTWKINKKIDNYNKNKNKWLIVLIIKFEEYDSSCPYKLRIICNIFPFIYLFIYFCMMCMDFA